MRENEWEGSWTEIGQSDWGMEGYLGGWPRRAMLELPNDDSKFLGNCSSVIQEFVVEFSPTSLSLSLSSNPSLYRIEDIPRGSDILLALPFEHRVRSRI